jgi:hypothetical protein
MGIYRIHTGDDGRSHLETIDPRTDPRITEPRPARELYFKRFPAGTALDRHPAPKRMMAVIVSGELEQGLGDGTVHRFGPGDVRFLEDTTGEGHTTRVVGAEDVLLAVVPLP